MFHRAPLPLLLALSATLAGCPDDDPLLGPDGGVPPPDVAFVEYLGPWDHGAADGPAPQDYAVPPDTIKVVPPAFVGFVAGSFTMGSPPTEPCRGTDESPRKVTLTRPFQIQNVEVTQQQFADVMGYQPFSSCGKACPAADVSWHEAAAYCNELSLRLGLKPCYVDVGSGAHCAHFYSCGSGESCILLNNTCRRYVAAPAYGGAKIYDCPAYRLPTDAEWEYAYRAGATTALHNGKELDPSQCKCLPQSAAASAIAWYCSNAGFSPQVGGPPKLPNAWGLYNMAGNVHEWVHDPPQVNLGSAAVTDPVGVGSNADRVIRGGYYNSHAAKLRAAKRDSERATHRGGGLRCVRTLKP